MLCDSAHASPMIERSKDDDSKSLEFGRAEHHRLAARGAGGVPGAAGRLAPLVYAELHRIAEAAMRREDEGHTLQPTLLVNEALMRLLGQDHSPWKNRAHFYALAAQTIRRILVDHAQARQRLKRDQGMRVTFTGARVVSAVNAVLAWSASRSRCAPSQLEQSTRVSDGSAAAALRDVRNDWRVQEVAAPDRRPASRRGVSRSQAPYLRESEWAAAIMACRRTFAPASRSDGLARSASL